MSIPTTNDGIGVLDFAESTITTYIGDELTTRNTNRSLSMPTDAPEFQRSDVLPRQFKPVTVGLYFVRKEITPRGNSYRRRMTMGVMVTLSAQSASAVDDASMSNSLDAYTEAIEWVLQRHMRSGTAGVISTIPQTTEFGGPFKVPGSAVWVQRAEVRLLVHQDYRMTETS